MTNAKTNKTPATEAPATEAPATDVIDTLKSKGTGEITVLIGDTPTTHSIVFENYSVSKYHATIDGQSGTGKSKDAAVIAALSGLYTDFDKGSMVNPAYGQMETIKTNKPADNLTEAQAQELRVYVDSITDGIDTLGNASKASKEANRTIGQSLNAAFDVLLASIRAEMGDDNYNMSNKRWGQWIKQLPETFQGSKGKNAVSEFRAVGDVSDNVFACIPAAKQSAKSITMWINEVTRDIAADCSEMLGNAKLLVTDAKGFDLILDTLAKKANADSEAGSTLAGHNFLAGEYHNQIIDLDNDGFAKHKLGKAIIKAYKTPEQEEAAEEAATEKAVTKAATAFADMTVEEAAKHLATILLAHSEPAEVYAAIETEMEAQAEALEAAQVAAEQAEQEEAMKDAEG